MSLNKVILIGNAGKSPEVKYLGDERNYKVARFTLATDEWYKDRDGQPREITSWHNIVAWNASADFVEKYIKKGMQLYVEGTLRYRTWTAADGSEKSVCEIMAKDMRILGKRQDTAETQPVTEKPSEPARSEDLPDDDLPF